MANDHKELMDQLLKSIGEEANTEIPFDPLHDSILLAKKREKKKRRTLIRSLTVAASFVVLFGAGAFFISHMGFGASMEMAADAAAPAAMDRTAGITETAAAEEAPAEVKVTDGKDSSCIVYQSEPAAAEGAETTEKIPMVPAEEPEKNQCAAAPADTVKQESVSAESSASEEPSDGAVSGAGSNTSRNVLAELTPALAQNADHILLGEVTIVSDDTCTVTVTERFRGSGEKEITFAAQGTGFEENSVYLLLLAEENGTYEYIAGDLFFLIEGDAAMVDGNTDSELPLEKLLDLLGIL